MVISCFTLKLLCSVVLPVWFRFSSPVLDCSPASRVLVPSCSPCFWIHVEVFQPSSCFGFSCLTAAVLHSESKQWLKSSACSAELKGPVWSFDAPAGSPTSTSSGLQSKHNKVLCLHLHPAPAASSVIFSRVTEPHVLEDQPAVSCLLRGEDGLDMKRHLHLQHSLS